MRPPRLDCLDWYRQPCAEGAPEDDWLEHALAGGAVAALWQSRPALVAPASYRTLLAGAPAGAQVDGWPVRQRRSGGGVVPQGPGIANLSLAWQPGGSVGECGEAVYRQLCDWLARACAALGLSCHASAVPGSFCDGRYNLACGPADRPRKLAGTAQQWRHRDGRHAVLAHAVLLIDADVERITAAVNTLESRLGTGRVFSADVLTTVAGERAAAGLPALDDAPAGLADALARALGTPLRER